MSVKKVIKKIIPKKIINFYHGLWSYLAAVYYGNPSKKMVVIGVTGTNGKSTTVNLIAKILESEGSKVALTSTANFKIGEKEWLNNLKMTMLGRHYLQKFLKDALKAGCEYTVIEVSSEALEQNRHWRLYVDAAVFTNLTPEHIESHGSFENYKSAKKKLFDSLNRKWRKKLNGRTVPTIIAANSDDEHAAYYLDSKSDKKITFGVQASNFSHSHIKSENIKTSFNGISYAVNNEKVELSLRGKFNVYNSLAALAVGKALDISLSKSVAALKEFPGMPGRLELVQTDPFMVLVDYAYEPVNLRALYDTVSGWNISGRIIHVLGSTGGGRDISRRPVLGGMAGKNADIVVVTNEDPYDDDPEEIVDQVAKGAQDSGKEINKNLFEILDRRKAIAKALSLAKPEDLVMITGKGSEQKMAVKDGYIDWDDRKVVREELKKI